MPRVVARYPYQDEEGNLLYEVERLDPKGFRQRKPGEGDEWIYQLGNTRRVPYRLPELLAARDKGDVLTVVEGEKDVETLVKLGHAATTIPGGAGKWREEYTEIFRGAKVAVITDNDETGMRHALQVASALDPVAEKLWVLRPDEGHKDVTDHLDAGLTMKDLRPFEWRSRLDPKREQTEIRVMSVRELMATPDPKDEDKLWGPALMRGHRMIVAAYNGHGKSTFSMWLIAAIISGREFLGWAGQGNCRALVLDVEQGRWTLKHRFTEAGLDSWPERVELVHAPDGLALDCNKRQCRDLEGIFERGKYDVVLADPLYKLHRTTVNDERNAVDLMRRFDSWRERYGFALIMPMHCRKPQAGREDFNLADISGVAALGQGAEIIIGLDRKDSGFTHLHWWKDRDGYTNCLMEKWGLLFDRATGFKRNPRDLEDTQVALRDEVRRILTSNPGCSIEHLEQETGKKRSPLNRALEEIGAYHDGAKYIKDRRWRLPDELFKR